jgi:hypothetical protein
MYTSTTQPRDAGPEPLPPTSSSHQFGLRVRVAIDTTQRYLFGDDGPSLLTRLAEELCIQMARIVVMDFRIHSQLDRTVPAVLRNVRLGFWSCARPAALDAASALAAGAKRRVVQSDLAIKAANLALRIAELCESAERKVRCEKQGVEDYERAVRSEFAAMHREHRNRESR